MKREGVGTERVRIAARHAREAGCERMIGDIELGQVQGPARVDRS